MDELAHCAFEISSAVFYFGQQEKSIVVRWKCPFVRHRRPVPETER